MGTVWQAHDEFGKAAHQATFASPRTRAEYHPAEQRINGKQHEGVLGLIQPDEGGEGDDPL